MSEYAVKTKNAVTDAHTERLVLSILIQKAHHNLQKLEPRMYSSLHQAQQIIDKAFKQHKIEFREYVNLLENVLDPNSPLQRAHNDPHRLLEQKEQLMDSQNWEACMVIMHAIGSCKRKIYTLDQPIQTSDAPTIRHYNGVTYQESPSAQQDLEIPFPRLQGGNTETNPGTFREFLAGISTDPDTRQQLQQLHQPHIPPPTQFLESLHPSERTLINSVSINIPLEEMTSQWDSIPIATSDGLVLQNTYGTYGWVISNSNGECLATCNGQARGKPMTSHRAESFGMWSILVFIIRAFQFYQKASIYCDNEALVNTVIKSLQEQDPTFQMILLKQTAI